LSSPSTASLKRAYTAAWIVALGSVAGIALAIATSWVALGVILFLVLMIDGLVLVVLRSWIRSRLTASLPETPEGSLTYVVITTLTLGIIDAFFFGQAVISFILCVAGVLYFLPRAIAGRRDSARFKLRLSKAAITTVVGFAALGIIVYGNVVARERAESLIVAVEQFYAKHSRYPERLDEIVPEFISEIPKAKYVVIADRFRYFKSDSRHSLMYVEMPPYGRRIYTFEDHKWTSLD
jgi:hypothetical protein